MLISYLRDFLNKILRENSEGFINSFIEQIFPKQI